MKTIAPMKLNNRRLLQEKFTYKSVELQYENGRRSAWIDIAMNGNSAMKT